MEQCYICQLPKAQGACFLCQCNLCRKCSQYVEAADFELDPNAPEEWFEQAFCHICYGNEVAEKLEAYNKTAAAAREVHYWPRTYHGTVTVLKKGKEKVSAEGGKAAPEILLRLAFLAVQKGFNALIQGEIKGVKVRNEGYQKTVWHGTALPAQVNVAEIERQEYREENWQLL